MSNGKNKNGERRKLGRNQASLLCAMVKHGGKWEPKTWTWGPRSETTRLLGVLESRSCVERSGDTWTVTDEGQASLAELMTGAAEEGSDQVATQDIGLLVGRTIVGMRRLSEDEAAREGWDIQRVNGPPPVLILDDGTLVYPSRDYMGNGPGALFGIHNEERVAFTCVAEEVPA